MSDLQRYRRRPLEVRAVQWHEGDPMPEGFELRETGYIVRTNDTHSTPKASEYIYDGVWVLYQDDGAIGLRNHGEFAAEMEPVPDPTPRDKLFDAMRAVCEALSESCYDADKMADALDEYQLAEAAYEDAAEGCE